MVCNLDPQANYEDEILVKEHEINDGDIVTVVKIHDLYYTIDYEDEDGEQLCLFESQVIFPVIATELGRVLFPDAKEKEGKLWIK